MLGNILLAICFIKWRFPYSNILTSKDFTWILVEKYFPKDVPRVITSKPLFTEKTWCKYV